MLSFKNSNNYLQADSQRSVRTTLVGNSLCENTPGTSGEITFYSDDGSCFHITKGTLATGLLLIGATGSGKTTQFSKIISSTLPGMGKKDVMLILDSKGDYAERFYDPYNPAHVLISSKPEHRAETRYWNVFREIINVDGTVDYNSELQAKEISKALLKGLDGGQQPFFPMAAADTLNTIIMSFIYDEIRGIKTGRLNNKSLTGFINSIDSADRLYRQVCRYRKFRRITGYLGKGDSNQGLGVIGFLQAANSNLFGPFAENDPEREFGMRDLIRNKGGKVIFLEWDVAASESLKPIYSLLLDIAIKQACCMNDGGNTYLIADELNIVPHVQRLQDAVNYGRSKGIKCIAGLQSISQLYNNYGEEEGKAITAGFLSMFAFNAVDYETRNFISERFGKTFDSYEFGGAHQTREGYTVEDCDIRNLGVGEAFIDIKNTAPFAFKFKKQ